MTLHGDKICSKCGKDWMRCDCQNYHPPIIVSRILSPTPIGDIYFSKNQLLLNREEVKALYKVLETQYIHQDHELAHQVIKKMYEFLKVQ